MYELLSVPHESGMMSMWTGIYGIFNDVSDSNFAFKPTQKQRLKRKRLATKSLAFSFSNRIRDNA